MSDTLEIGEPHPACHIAMEYVRNNLDLLMQESIASCAIEDNRAAEIALGTIKRLEKREPVSDRYLMGLAWFIYGVKNDVPPRSKQIVCSADGAKKVNS